MRAALPCPRCGAEMNFHAEKLYHSAEPEPRDPDLGGTLVEIHLCRACGFILERLAK